MAKLPVAPAYLYLGHDVLPDIAPSTSPLSSIFHALTVNNTRVSTRSGCVGDFQLPDIYPVDDLPVRSGSVNRHVVCWESAKPDFTKSLLSVSKFTTECSRETFCDGSIVAVSPFFPTRSDTTEDQHLSTPHIMRMEHPAVCPTTMPDLTFLPKRVSA